MKLRNLLVLFLTVLAVGCSKSSAPEKEAEWSKVPLCTNCGLNFKSALSQNFPNQIYVSYRKYFTTDSAMAKGTLFARFCKDSACSDEVARLKVSDGVMLSTGFTTDFNLKSAPVGENFVQLGLFTDYASKHQGEAFKQFSVLQTEQGVIETNNDGNALTNPAASSVKVNIKEGGATDAGVLILGHIVFDAPRAPVASERKIWVPSGDVKNRGNVRIVSEGSKAPEETLDRPRLGGTEFSGDICGSIKAPDATYLVGLGANAAYIFEYDPVIRKQRHENAAFVPHPDAGCTKTAIACFTQPPKANLSLDKFPKPCTGTSVDKDNERTLYLTRDVNDDTDSIVDRLIEVDVTDLKNGNATTTDESAKIGTYAVRNISVSSNVAYLTTQNSKILKYDMISRAVMPDTIPAETSGPDCGGTTRNVPATIVANFKGGPKLFVGNDLSIKVFDMNNALVGQIDTSRYGKVITDFALSPDGKTLYAVPACKSDIMGNFGTSTQASSHHQVVVLDLTSGTTVPNVLYADRDFDGDGTADGGIDLEFHNIKRDILKWCESCFGELPPVYIRMPRITATEKYLYLRGNSGTKDYGNSGLGQLGDIAVFDIGAGEGLIFQDYVPWLNGPSGRWGIPLDAKELATGGMIAY